MKKLYYSITLLILISCTKQVEKKQFTLLTSEKTGINFKNTLTESDSLNYFNYPYIYMGGGIAIGDFNNDNLQDVYFTANMVSNRLYLNKGDLTFEDITESSNAGLGNEWSLGATTCDINNDGWLDIYINVSGKDRYCPNKLLVNQGKNEKGEITFKEEAKKYGIADKGHSTQSTFFDYDNDGDLDLYVANYPITKFSTPPYVFKKLIEHATLENSNHLYENDGNGFFTDVTEKAGLLSYSLSLSANVSDLNNDGFKDIYVSNDFASADFCYMNNGDGTFTNSLKESVKHTALYGMGVDIADVNNDGFLDVFQADMDASTNARSKANMASMNPKVFWDTYNNGLYYQYMHNCLQLNAGVLTPDDYPIFNNISRMSNTSSTDWSWGPVFADLDNDGWKDLYISNGTRREINNNDFFNEIKKNKKAFQKQKTEENLENSLRIPSEKVDNFAFRNNKDLTFSKVNSDWGIEFKGFSNGVAYADLDNDGDLEIILNNIDDEAVIFENNNPNKNNHVSFEFEGCKNTRGIGVKCTIVTDDIKQFQELTLEHGYISSMAPILHFGVAKTEKVTVKVEWPDGKQQILENLEVNKTHTLNYADAKENTKTTKTTNSKTFITNFPVLDTIYKHEENVYNDFDTQVLLPHKMSTLGPAVAVKDVNNDGLDDFFIGGSKGQESSIYIQKEKGFKKQDNSVFKKHKISEDTGALFFDIDNDGDSDLYVVSGGYEFENQSEDLKDRLYVNDGKGNFSISKGIPAIKSSGSKAYQIDFNKDGKQDILVLGRQVPGNYPHPTSSYLLENTSEGNTINFIDKTIGIASEFQNLGMATSAVITDFNNDSWDDIIIVGEWMSIKIFKNNQGVFKEVSKELGLTQNTTGWWWSIAQGDFDKDGDMDFIIGNNGLNYKYKATEDETFDIYVKDFDKNLKSDIVLSYYNEGKQYPVRGRQCSSEQIPGIKKKFKNYDMFSKATLTDVYGKKNLENALHYQVESFSSIYLENDNGYFKIHTLPIEAQVSSINQILIDDYDKDGNLDAVIAGNLYQSEVETPRNDASHGLFLKGNGKGEFISVPVTESGFYSTGDVKDLKPVSIGAEKYILSAKNNDYLQFIKINN